MSGLPTYGMRERLAARDAMDMYVQEIQLVGYAVVADAVPSDQLPGWRERLDLVLARQTNEVGGAEHLRRLGEEHTARAVLAYDEAFLELAVSSTVLGICERLLGPAFILNQQNGIVNPPAGRGHHQTAYHRDLPYQHFVSSRPIAISALCCLDAFNEQTGGTLVLPGSHKLEAFPSDEVVEKLEQRVVARAGSYVVFDSMLFHRAGVNRSSGPRRGVNHVWSLPIIKQQIVLPGLLRAGLERDRRLAGLLGYDSDSPRSVREWIDRRKKKATT